MLRGFYPSAIGGGGIGIELGTSRCEDECVLTKTELQTPCGVEAFLTYNLGPTSEFYVL